MKFKKVSKTGILPTKAYKGDAGFDLYADENIIIEKCSCAKIRTGVSVTMDSGIFGLVKDRSSLAQNLVFVVGGVIDSSYKGEVMVMLYNFSNCFIYEIKKGDKIAQIIPVKIKKYRGVFERRGKRGKQGFGSSGR